MEQAWSLIGNKGTDMLGLHRIYGQMTKLEDIRHTSYKNKVSIHFFKENVIINTPCFCWLQNDMKDNVSLQQRPAHNYKGLFCSPLCCSYYKCLTQLTSYGINWISCISRKTENLPTVMWGSKSSPSMINYWKNYRRVKLCNIDIDFVYHKLIR